MPGDEQLHIWTNGTDFWVAATAEAARDAMNKEQLEGKGTDEELDGEDGEWSQVPDDKVIHIESDEKKDHCDKHEKHCIAKTALAWTADYKAPGFLCSWDC